MSGFVLVRGPQREHAVQTMCAVLHHRGEEQVMMDVHDTRIAVLCRGRAGHFRGAVGRRSGIAAFIEGWIENAADLRAAQSGVSLPTALAAEFRRRGERVLMELRGAFVAGVMEETTGRLLLHRSAAGQRPAYYWQHGDALLAASEVKAVLAHPHCSRRLDPVVLGHLLVTGVEPHDRSLAAEVLKLPPGHVLEHAPGARAVTRLLSPVRFAVGAWTDAEDAAEALHGSLDEGVRTGLCSHEGALGVFLSGGVDSYLVGESVSRQAGGRGVAGTAGVLGDSGDESTAAATRARQLGLSHVAVSWTGESADYTLLDLLDASVRATEQPGRYENALLVTHLLRQWPQLPPVLFSGDMADVLFGDPYYRALDRAELLQRVLPWAPLRQALGLIEHVPLRHARSLAQLLRMEQHDFRLYFGGQMRHQGADRLLGFDPTGPIQESFEQLAGEARDLTRSQRYCYVHLRTSGQGSIDKLERLVSAAGSDLVHPFLAADVYQLGFALPPTLKYRRGATKIVPRALAARSLPLDVVWGSRRGFSAPRGRWVTEDRAVRGAVDSLRSRDARVRGYVDGPSLDGIIHSLHGPDGHAYTDQLWILLSVELWCRHLHI
jgi:asparagine synthase (glutamine-hydrolysing)